MTDVSPGRGRARDFFGKKKSEREKVFFGKKSERTAGVTNWKCICKKAADLPRQVRRVISAIIMRLKETLPEAITRRRLSFMMLL